MTKRFDRAFPPDPMAPRGTWGARAEPSNALVMRDVRKDWAAGCGGCSARVRVLRGVALRVPFGEIVGIAGAAGAGKTTLLLCAAGLLRLDAGVVARRGRWVRYLAPEAGAAARLAALATLPPAAQVAPPPRRSSGVAEHAGGGEDGAGLILLDELPHAGLGAVAELLRRRAAGGDAVLVASRDAAALEWMGAGVLVLADGTIAAGAGRDQRRNRAAARSSASSPDACAAARMRSTCGRRLRSPQ